MPIRPLDFLTVSRELGPRVGAVISLSRIFHCTDVKYRVYFIIFVAFIFVTFAFINLIFAILTVAPIQSIHLSSLITNSFGPVILDAIGSILASTAISFISSAEFVVMLIPVASGLHLPVSMTICIKLSPSLTFFFASPASTDICAFIYILSALTLANI